MSRPATTSRLSRKLFNGKDLTGWDGNPKIWSVEDGEIVGRTTADAPLEKNTFLIWQGGELGDFRLRLQYRVQNGNSGVQYRSHVGRSGEVDRRRLSGRHRFARHTGILYEELGRGILAERGQKVTIAADGKRTAEKFADAAELQKSIHANDWNDYVIEARGERLRHWINGKLMSETVDAEREKRAEKGILALQVHVGPPMTVRFRKIELETLNADSPDYVPKHRCAGTAGAQRAPTSGVHCSMERRSHVLIDAGESIVADGAVFQGRGTSAGGRDWSVRLRTCRGGRSEGVHVVELDNGQIVIDVLPTRGMGIWRIRRGSHTLGWRSPIRGPVHPAFVPLYEPSGLGWLDGFDELLCRCGLESNGPPVFDEAGKLLHPLHGRIANLPASLRGTDRRRGRSEIDAAGRDRRVAIPFSKPAVDDLAHDGDRLERVRVDRRGGKHRRPRRHAARCCITSMSASRNYDRARRIVAPVAIVAPLTQIAAQDGVERWNVMPPPRPRLGRAGVLLRTAGRPRGQHPRAGGRPGR